MTPAQCRAGRALLGCSIDDLAASARIEPEVIEAFEAGKLAYCPRRLGMIETALDVLGVMLIPEAMHGAGVRLKASPTRLGRAAD